MLSSVAQLFSRLDAWVSAGVGEKWNPFLHLGSLAITHIIIALVSGILLLFFYDLNIHSAYESVASMMQTPWGAGLLRSLHRYSSDLAILLSTLHFIKIFSNKIFQGPRALSWVTGCFSIFCLWFVGWTGFWLVWDQTGFELALFTTRLIDGIPLFGTTLEASLLSGDATNSNIFFIVFFVHMLLPLGLFILLWIHVSRVNRPRFIASRGMGALCLGFLLCLSVLAPAFLENKASPFVLQETLHLDLFYLLPLKLFNRLSAPELWFVFLFSFLFLNLLPWILKSPKKQASLVTENLCVGCTSCFNDCPYQAIELRPRTDGKPYKYVAWVDPERCVSCGVCNGSCDTLGNNLPGLPTEFVLQKIEQWALQKNQASWLLFVCREIKSGLKIQNENSILTDLPHFRVMELPCIGHVNPQSVRHALDNGFKGVYIAASLAGDCLYREGNQWLEDRLSNKRKPFARLRADQISKVKVGHYSQGNFRQLMKDLKSFSGQRLFL